MAVLHAIANRKNIPLYKLISSEAHDHIRLSGLLHGDKATVQTQARQMLEEGYTSFRLSHRRRAALLRGFFGLFPAVITQGAHEVIPGDQWDAAGRACACDRPYRHSRYGF